MITALYALYVNVMKFTPDTGDPESDAQIASTLGVSALPYTSNDADAQTLIPPGWRWGLDDQENIVAVRDSDGTSSGTYLLLRDDSPLEVPDPLTHCVVALQAHLVEANDLS